MSDEPWAIVQPLLPGPKPQRFRHPGRQPLDDRQVLTGILFVWKSGIPWEMLSQELGCGSEMTCGCRLRDGPPAGVWSKRHATLLSRLHGAERLDGPRACVDSPSVRAVGDRPQPYEPGSQHHVLAEARGIPLAAILTGAHRHDITQLWPRVAAVPPVRVDPAINRRGCTPTGLTTRDSIAGHGGNATSRRPWPGGARHAVAD